MPLAVAGMEGEKEFTRVMLGDEMELDVDLAREEHIRVARRLVSDHPDIGAIVLECTNMPPYAADIQRETGRAGVRHHLARPHGPRRARRRPLAATRLAGSCRAAGPPV